MELQVGVKILLKNREGKFLLIRRADDKYVEVEHKWDIPGGRIEPEGGLRENLAREVMEETGLTFTSEPRVIAAQDIFPTGKDRHVVRITYLGTTEGEPKLSDEHSEFIWVTLSELKSQGNLDKYLKAILKEGALRTD